MFAFQSAVSGHRLMIFDLPDEIWLLVMDNLDLHHLFTLSHVSTRTRRLAYKDWQPTISQLQHRQRLDFWTGLAFLYLDHWVCANCNRMHPIRESDGSGPHRCLSLEPNKRWFFNDKRNLFSKHYVFHSDIQLALKRHARGIYDDDVIAGVLKPYDHSRSITPARRYPPHKIDRHISPKIVRGRFLVYYRHTIHGSHGHGLIMRICRHLAAITTCTLYRTPFVEPRTRLSSNKLIYRLFCAYKTPKREFSDSCSSCPVDFAVSSPDGRGIDLQVWYDFGTYASPEDISWTVHSFNSRWLGQSVDHVHGSARALYVEEHGHVTPRAS